MTTLSDPVLIIFGTFILHQVIFWIHNAILLLFTYVIYPDRSKKYKIQKDVYVDWKSIKECTKTVIINQIFVLFPALVITCPLFMHLNVRWHIPIPPWYRILFELFCFLGVTEIFFYYSHLALHFSSVYEYIHKKHHRFRAPIGMAAEYAHPIEFIVSNITPVIAGPLLFQSHLLTTWLWLVIALTGTVNHHSGYKLPGILGSGLSNPAFHDFHHAKFTNNFGLLGILDRVHGTDTAWQAKKAKQYQQGKKKEK